MNPLDNLEQLAQRFVEGIFHRFFGKALHTADLANQLVASIEAGRNGREEHLIPVNYQIMINPSDYAALVQQNNSKGITSELVAYLTAFADETNYQIDGPLRIVLDKNEAVQPGHIEISTAIEPIDRGRP